MPAEQDKVQGSTPADERGGTQNTVDGTQNNVDGPQNNVGGNQYNMIFTPVSKPPLSTHARELFCCIAAPLVAGAQAFRIWRGGDKLHFRFMGGRGNFERDGEDESSLLELVNAGYINLVDNGQRSSRLTGAGEQFYKAQCEQGT